MFYQFKQYHYQWKIPLEMTNEYRIAYFYTCIFYHYLAKVTSFMLAFVKNNDTLGEIQ